jgi:uncharacterized protein
MRPVRRTPFPRRVQAGKATMPEALARLQRVLGTLPRLVVAVSGGVDSLTLAHVASRLPGLDLRVLHAVSPAVLPAATERVQRHAREAGWALSVVDAGEYADPRYRRNPLDRCFYCKTNLYACIRGLTDAPITSGTNLDDLGEYRPGLEAAREHGVRHPFVEAGIGKATVRAIAAQMGLDDIAELPAQPCLASRVETGIAIEAGDLAFAAQVEDAVGQLVGPGDIRCRVTADGIRLEIDPQLLARTPFAGDRLDRLVAGLCAAEGRRYAGRRAYRRGSAFLLERSGAAPAR